MLSLSKIDHKQVSFNIVQISLKKDARCIYSDAHAEINFQFVMFKNKNGQ